MNRDDVVSRLRQNQPRLRELGLEQVSLFGSTARGMAGVDSDVDLAVTVDCNAGLDIFRFAAIREHLRRMLGSPVDLVVEPARNARVQAAIDRDRVRVF